jgi:hypothetical protein
VDLLPILYALLAAVTGIGGGDRVAVAAPAAISASSVSGCPTEEARIAAVASALAAHRPAVELSRLADSLGAPVWTTVSAALISTISTFAHRRE